MRSALSAITLLRVEVHGKPIGRDDESDDDDDDGIESASSEDEDWVCDECGKVNPRFTGICTGDVAAPPAAGPNARMQCRQCRE